MEPMQASCWFLCEFCKRGFQKIEKLILHRQEEHFGESSKTSKEARTKSGRRSGQEVQLSRYKPGPKSKKFKSKRLPEPADAASTDVINEDHAVPEPTPSPGIKSSAESQQSSQSNTGIDPTYNASDSNSTSKASDIQIMASDSTLATSHMCSELSSSVASEERSKSPDEIEFVTEIAPPSDEIIILKRGIPATKLVPGKRKRISDKGNESEIQQSAVTATSSPCGEDSEVQVLTPKSSVRTSSMDDGQDINMNVSPTPIRGTRTRSPTPEIYICANCPRMCATKDALEKHVKLIHKRIKATSPAPEPIIIDVDDGDNDDVNSSNLPTSNLSEIENHQIPNSTTNMPDTLIVTIDENCHVDFDNTSWKDSFSCP